MRLVVILMIVMAVAGAARAAEEQPARVCLRPSDISNTTIIDDSTILFRMKGGKIWKNELEGKCFGLKIEGGFSYEVRGDAICGNQQPIKVLRSMTHCMLGAFTAYVEPPNQQPDIKP
jgi:hypothetical protein